MGDESNISLKFRKLIPEQVASLIEKWTNDYTPGRDLRINRQLVHKHNRENVLVVRAEKVETSLGEIFFVAEVLQDNKHSFFYEHPSDHVPGLYIIEATRQVGTAILHLYLGVAMDSPPTIFEKMEVNFQNYAENNRPLFVVGKIAEKRTSEGNLESGASSLDVVQGQTLVAEIKMEFRIVAAAVYRLMRMKYEGKKVE